MAAGYSYTDSHSFHWNTIYTCWLLRNMPRWDKCINVLEDYVSKKIRGISNCIWRCNKIKINFYELWGITYWSAELMYASNREILPIYIGLHNRHFNINHSPINNDISLNQFAAQCIMAEGNGFFFFFENLLSTYQGKRCYNLLPQRAVSSPPTAMSGFKTTYHIEWCQKLLPQWAVS